MQRFTFSLTAIVALTHLLGCVSTDRCVQEWVLRPQHVASDSSPGSEARAGRVSVGMTKADVRNTAAPFVVVIDEHVWKLEEQFRPVAPGLYPSFDSREVYLYFDDLDRLVAINVRGSYSVYP